MGEESQALQDIHISYEAEEDYLEEQQNRYFENIYQMEIRYKDNANSNIGTTIRCACCGKKIIKKNYNTQFCKNKGANNCKDNYWNNVSDKRRRRAQSIIKYRNS